MAGAVDAIARLRNDHDLIIVTSRQLVIKEATLSWLHHNFPENTFESINFGNAFALSGEQRTKAEICLEHNCDILIDDNPKYVKECADVGIETLLYDHNLQNSWSKGPEDNIYGDVSCLSSDDRDIINREAPRDSLCDGNVRITRVSDWEQVERWIAKRSKVIAPVTRNINNPNSDSYLN